MRSERIEIGTPGIKKALSKYQPESSIAELVWNGFDAGATLVSIEYEPDPVGGIDSIRIVDNGPGISGDHLAEKFKPFLHSSKIYDPNDTHYGPSAKHGKNGMGRLTFYTFASKAVWTTTYERAKRDYRQYSIIVSASKLQIYERTAESSVEGPSGTTVGLTGVFALSDYTFDRVNDYLAQEFAWFLELASPSQRVILINDEQLDCSRIVGERDNFEIDIEGTPFEVRYVRWNSKLHSEYSRYYFIGSDNRERAKKHTTFNNKGDDFYHSVYVRSCYFDTLEGLTILLDSNDGHDEQPPLLHGFERDEIFKELIRYLSEYLSRKRSPFLRRRAAGFVSELEAEGAFPSFGPELWEQHRKRELVDVVRDLYEADPRIFNGLSNQQRQTLVRLFSLIMDSSERDHLLDVMAQVVNLDKDERMELARILQSSQLSNVIATIKLIEDRYIAVDELKKMVYAAEFGANERDHLQTHIEQHYWLFGEQFHLVTAAEADFEKALRQFVFILQGTRENLTLDHPDKKKQMDIFAVRWLPQVDQITNVVLELKHPDITLGKKQLDQVKEYMDVILHQPEFNAKNMSWEFYLVGTGYNDYIEREMENAQPHGQPHLVYKASKYRIFVLNWSEVTTNFELRHNFLLDKLKLERTRLATTEDSADGIISKSHRNSARAIQTKA